MTKNRLNLMQPWALQTRLSNAMNYFRMQAPVLNRQLEFIPYHNINPPLYNNRNHNFTLMPRSDDPWKYYD